MWCFMIITRRWCREKDLQQQQPFLAFLLFPRQSFSCSNVLYKMNHTYCQQIFFSCIYHFLFTPSLPFINQNVKVVFQLKHLLFAHERRMNALVLVVLAKSHAIRWQSLCLKLYMLVLHSSAVFTGIQQQPVNRRLDSYSSWGLTKLQRQQKHCINSKKQLKDHIAA